MIKFMSALMLSLLLTALALGQATTGKLIGTVTDGAAMVPGATVTVRDNQTGASKTAVSDDQGGFIFSQLEFGRYTVEVSAKGFKSFTAKDVKIDAGQEYSLTVPLEVGGVSETVTVTAGADTINSTNAELSTTISQQQIRELPLNTRNPLGLLNLIAGANPTTSSIDGQRSSSTDYRRDGLNVQDNFIRTGGFVSDQPTVDDTSEFSVTTQNAGPDQGGGSSNVNLVTPRGGKGYHGALYEFNRNSKFTSNSFTNNELNIARPFLNRNQFGGSLSGPLPFPNFGENNGPMFKHDKTFFFFNYEAFRLAQQVTASGTTLLPAARNGTFTYTCNQVGGCLGATVAQGQPVTVNVLNGTGFSSALTAGQGGSLGVDPIIQARILSGLPTTANGTTITGINFTQSTSFLRADPLTRNSATGRFDYDINDHSNFNAVYRWNNQVDARTDQAAGFSPTAFVNQGGPTHFFVAAYRWTPTASFSNEVRGGFQLSHPFFTESNVPQDFLLAVPLVTNPQGTFRSQGRDTDYRNIQDNAVYSWGNHSFRFGGQFERYKIRSVNLAGTTPTYSISTTADPNTPGLTASQVCGSPTCISSTDLARANSLRYFLGGIIGAASRTANVDSTGGYGFGPDIQPVDYNIYSAYGSDQWRFRPNLTLNLGLRYEYYTPLHTPVLRFLEPVFTNGDMAASVQDPNGTLNLIGTNAGRPGYFTKPDKNNFSPNVSFAWSPQYTHGPLSMILGGSTVIRGGFRLSYINDEYVKAPLTLTAGNRGLGAVTVPGRIAGGTDTNLKTSLTPIPGFDPLPVFNTLPTTPTLPLTFAQYRALGSTSTQLFGVDPHLQLGRVYEWNIGIQRNIGFKTVLELRYVGNMSNDLIRTTDFNEIDIVKNGFLADFQRGQSNLALYDKAVAACVAGGGTLGTCTNTTTGFGPRSAGFNAKITGSQQTPVLTQTSGGGALLLTNTTVFLPEFDRGEAGAAAQSLITNNLRGNVVFQPNPNLLVSEIITNAGKQRYNALQAEVRRRFSGGLYFQANYTFQKTLTDVPDDSQNRQGEVQEGDNPNLNYGRPDYDRTHTFNFNAIYELPFGKGKQFLSGGGWSDRIFGGFQVSSIVNISSGAPLAIVDPRGTRSIAFKSGRQSAISSLTPNQIKALTGVFDTPNGRYFIDPKVLFATANPACLGQGGCTLPVLSGIDLTKPLPAGYVLGTVRAASPIGTAPFPGQVFFFNNSGQTGNLPRNFVNGLPYVNWDAGLAKNIRFSESKRLELRVEAFDILNHQVQSFNADLNINSDSFGRITSTGNTPRIIQFGVRFDF